MPSRWAPGRRWVCFLLFSNLLILLWPQSLTIWSRSVSSTHRPCSVMRLADASLSCGFGSVMLCLIGDGLLCPLLCQQILWQNSYAGSCSVSRDLVMLTESLHLTAATNACWFVVETLENDTTGFLSGGSQI
jgi:hypothetical protein